MKLGYARVSTQDQSLDLQRDALVREGCSRVFEEKVSGVGHCRPALRAAMRRLRPGDVLIVWRLDRLGRSLQDLIEILQDLDRRSIGFRSISDGIDTTTAIGNSSFTSPGPWLSSSAPSSLSGPERGWKRRAARAKRLGGRAA